MTTGHTSEPGAPQSEAPAHRGSSPTRATPADPAALRADLAALGLDAEIEEHGGLALLHTNVGSLRDDALRSSVVELATSSGFTHVAIELSSSPQTGD